MTQLLLSQGANPNVRTTFAEGLRMHPLSWNVYGGHMQNVKLLLEGGANVNLDFDYLIDGKFQKVTVLDVLLDTILGDDPSHAPEQYQQIHRFLLSHGARRYVAEKDL